MAFLNPNLLTSAFLKVGYRCEACGDDIFWISGETPRGFLHSASTLHVVRSKDDPDFCEVTSPPDNMKGMKGKRLRTRNFLVFALGKDHDGFCFCRKCHVRLHTLANKVASRPGGKNHLPFELEKLTIEFVARRGQMTP